MKSFKAQALSALVEVQDRLMTEDDTLKQCIKRCKGLSDRELIFGAREACLLIITECMSAIADIEENLPVIEKDKPQYYASYSDYWRARPNYSSYSGEEKNEEPEDE